MNYPLWSSEGNLAKDQTAGPSASTEEPERSVHKARSSHTGLQILLRAAGEGTGGTVKGQEMKWCIRDRE